MIYDKETTLSFFDGVAKRNGTTCNNIIYDESITKENCIFMLDRSCICDSTLYFLVEMMSDMAMALIAKSIYEEEKEMLKQNIVYKIGGFSIDDGLCEVPEGKPKWMNFKYSVSLPVGEVIYG